MAARAGDHDAFKDLYLRNVRPIFGFLAARTDRSSAEDLTAETFARAYAAIGRYEPRGAPFRSWLFRIAHNLLIGRARRRDHSDVPLESDQAERISVGDGAERVDAALEAEDLRACLGRLSDAHAEVLDLRYLRELSVGETAAVLEIGEDAVRALTYRALKALRAEFSRTSAGRRE